MINHELTDLSYSDLAPSLQDLLKAKVSKNDMDRLSNGINKLANNIGEITVTVGNTVDRPESAKDDKNIHMNIEDNVLECYSGGSWKRQTGIFR